MYEYEFPMPAVTADVVALTFMPIEGVTVRPSPHVLLIERGKEPYKGHWALPGGFAEPNERLESAAVRELEEETGVFIPDLDPQALVGVYSAPGRDPRGWVISVTYAVYVGDGSTVAAGDDASDARWVPLRDLRAIDFAFDHRDMVAASLRRFGLAFPE